MDCSRWTLETFRTPYDGVILYFAGTIIEAIFGIVIIGAEFRGFLHLIDGYDPLLWLIVFFGTMLTFIGIVLGLTMGSFRLKPHFGRSTFGHAGILFTLGLIFPLFSIIGAILLYRRISPLSLKGETIEFAS